MQNALPTTTLPSFTRDRLTWLMYILMGTYTYLQVLPGSIIPFLQSELHLNYTLDSLHLSSLALGSIVAGFLGNRLIQWWGRGFVLRLGAIGMLTGVALLATGHVVVLTISSLFIVGLLGTLLMICAQSALSDRHGAQRTTALTEANAFTSIIATLAPLSLGVLLAFGLGWREMLWLPVIVVGILVFLLRNVAIPDALKTQKVTHDGSDTSHKQVRPVPLAFWLYLLVLILVLALEWAIIFWGSNFLIHSVGINRNIATTLMSLFFLAEAVGRIVGSLLTRRLAGGQVLIGSICVTMAGFLLFWLAPLPLVHIVGLFIAGFGIANLFPLALALLTQQTPEQADMASGRAAAGGGLAILVMPFVLGRIADMVGLWRAFSFELLLIIGAAAMIYFANRCAKRRTPSVSISDIVLPDAQLVEPAYCEKKPGISNR
jgi:MFS family permease